MSDREWFRRMAVAGWSVSLALACAVATLYTWAPGVLSTAC
ncbi:hypothetical protein [Prauserella halophila]|nr:hypothetical protein [Prauserella halophila]